MTFGMYKGFLMEEVPAYYLHRVYTEYIGPHTEPIKKYVEENLDALKQEYPDGIWKRKQ